MNFSSKLKRIRKKTGFSQEKLAEKIGVSRQAVTKWETGNGIPDIENLVNISKLFNISLDELILEKEIKKEKLEYVFESINEYDIDSIKNFDIKLCDANSIFINGYDGEKLYIKLYSNTLMHIEKNLKVKIDDIKNCIDIFINNYKGYTRSELKEELSILVQVPNRYVKNIELSVSSKSIELNSLEAKNIELNIKTNNIYLNNNNSNIEIDCNEDIQLFVNSLEKELSINQYMATSKLFICQEIPFKVIKKGIGTKIYYEINGEKVSDFSKNDSNRTIEFNGIKSELIISKLIKGEN